MLLVTPVMGVPSAESSPAKFCGVYFTMGGLFHADSKGVVTRYGENLTTNGVIPTPRSVISCAFGGKDKKTLFIFARGAKDTEGNEVANAAQVWTIQMIAQGYKGRAK